MGLNKLQARPRAWASLLQVLGAQLPQPGTPVLHQLSQQLLQHHRLELRVVQDGTTGDPAADTVTTTQLDRRTRNLLKVSPASIQDGSAALQQPPDGYTWSVPAQHGPQGMQNVQQKCYTSTRANHLDLAFLSQSLLPLELTALSSQTLISSN